MVLIIVILIAILEAILSYINYLARVKYKKYFVEMNGFWRRNFDNKNKLDSFWLHPLLLSVITSLAYYRKDQVVLGLILGFMLFNVQSDWDTFKSRYYCITTNCEQLKNLQKCVSCKKSNLDNYKLSFPFLNVTLAQNPIPQQGKEPKHVQDNSAN